jgi:hypothetical protein
VAHAEQIQMAIKAWHRGWRAKIGTIEISQHGLILTHGYYLFHLRSQLQLQLNVLNYDDDDFFFDFNNQSFP